MSFTCNGKEIDYKTIKGGKVPPIALCAIDRQVDPAPLTLTESVKARASTHLYPRLANWLQARCFNPDLFVPAYYYDYIIIDTDLRTCTDIDYVSPTGYFKTNNPNIIITEYWSPADINIFHETFDELAFIFNHQYLTRDAFMKDVNGNPKRFFLIQKDYWTNLFNLMHEESRINFVKFLVEQLHGPDVITGIDGIFYDWSSTAISRFINNGNPANGPTTSYLNNGIADTEDGFDTAWFNAWLDMSSRCKAEFPEGKLMTGNGLYVTGVGEGFSYAPNLHGVLMESFMKGPIDFPSDYSWSNQMRVYSYYTVHGRQPSFAVLMPVNSPFQQPEVINSYQFVRFTLTSALMFNGYYASSASTHYQANHWFDEYSVNLATGVSEKSLTLKGYLGLPLGDAYNVVDEDEKLYDVLHIDGPSHMKTAGDKTAETKVWRRDYTNGIVICNPKSTSATVSLGGDFKKIQGITDSFNDGSVISSINLNSLDGCVLLRI